FLQRLNEMCARVPARDLGSLQIQQGQLARSGECLTICYNLGNDAPFMHCFRGQGLRIQQECLCPACPCTVTPCREDSISRYDSTGEIRDIIEGGPFPGNNYVG